MRDGRTRKIDRPTEGPGRPAYLDRHRAVLVTLTGTTAGHEYELDAPKLVIGRGPEAALRFDDPAMSREHAVIELDGDGFRVRDLGSTNGLAVNGRETLLASLSHGDRLQIGEHTFQLVIEERPQSPRSYVVEDD